MKKAISILAAAMMLSCTFVSCGSSKDDDKQEGLVGKWSATDETLRNSEKEEAEGEDGLKMTAKSAVVEFTADGKMSIYEEADLSESMYIDDDAFYYQGQKIPYVYDEKSLTVGSGVMERVDKSDGSSPYGKYKVDEKENGVVYEYNFESPGVCKATVSGSGEYTYDEETKTLTTTLDDEEDGPSTVELDGDTLKLTDKEGTDVYTRVK